jgi:ankyrin repeat protein
MHAVKKGNLEMISYLLGEQPDINVRGYKGQTVLHLATQTWVDDIFELLLETAGLDIDATDDNGMTAMHHAAKHDNVGFARILGRKANLEIKDSSTFRRTPLYIAIKEDKLSFAKALLKRGAQIDLKYLPKTRSSDVSNLLRKYQRQPSGSSAAG